MPGHAYVTVASGDTWRVDQHAVEPISKIPAMSRRTRSPLLPAVVILLALAVLLCLTLAMSVTGDHMAPHAALFCCLVLVVTVAVATFIPPAITVLAVAPSRPRAVVPVRIPFRPPDPITLGCLLI